LSVTAIFLLLVVQTTKFDVTESRYSQFDYSRVQPNSTELMHGAEQRLPAEQQGLLWSQTILQLHVPHVRLEEL